MRQSLTKFSPNSALVNNKFNITDEEYVIRVDNGTYSNFVDDHAGFGLAQWTYWSRKQNLINYAKETNSSIADLDMQLEYLYWELQNYFKDVLTVLTTSNDVRECSDIVLTEFEKPAVLHYEQRYEYSMEIYDEFHVEDNIHPDDVEEDNMTVERFTELYNEMRKGLQDNDSSAYSADARLWALSTGLINGNGTTIDGEPNCMWEDVLTREQLITVLYRFAQLIGEV